MSAQDKCVSIQQVDVDELRHFQAHDDEIQKLMSTAAESLEGEKVPVSMLKTKFCG